MTQHDVHQRWNTCEWRKGETLRILRYFAQENNWEYKFGQSIGSNSNLVQKYHIFAFGLKYGIEKWETMLYIIISSIRLSIGFMVSLGSLVVKTLVSHIKMPALEWAPDSGFPPMHSVQGRCDGYSHRVPAAHVPADHGTVPDSSCSPASATQASGEKTSKWGFFLQFFLSICLPVCVCDFLCLWFSNK